MKTLGINQKVIDKCVADTFEGTNYQEDENYVFSQFAEEWRMYGHNLYPSVVLNSKTFRGRMTPDNVFEAICASFQDEPRECRAWQIQEGIALPVGQSTGITQKTFFEIVVVLILINLSVIIVYRKWLNRELEKDMKLQVSSAVSQYVALSKIPTLKKIESQESVDEGF